MAFNLFHHGRSCRQTSALDGPAVRWQCTPCFLWFVSVETGETRCSLIETFKKKRSSSYCFTCYTDPMVSDFHQYKIKGREREQFISIWSLNLAHLACINRQGCVYERYRAYIICLHDKRNVGKPRHSSCVAQ